MTKPFYRNEAVTIYCGDARKIVPSLDFNAETVLSDPPYPNNADHFIEDIEAAMWFATTYNAQRWLWFWDSLQDPPIPLPLVAKHVWHKTNTNRPGNYEMIYECANEPRRASRVFPFPVIYPRLTGCTEATGHPTQKPRKLMKALVKLRKTTSIIDPFMGSGSTIEAAYSFGIPVVGIERDESHCQDAVARITQRMFKFAG